MEPTTLPAPRTLQAPPLEGSALDAARALDAYRLDAYIPERMVEEMYDGRTLSRLLARKVGRRIAPRLFSPSSPEERVVAHYAGIAVLDRPGQQKGGMASGQDFPRVLHELGVGRCERLLEYCAGPGYIGYSLLAAGWCETLALSDLNGEAVATARRTASFNDLEDRVSVYESDGLDQIPDDERWDLVVANPPHFLPNSDAPDDVQVFDPDWRAHSKFYASVGSHMRPGGLVMIAENCAGSDPAVFEDMIREGGGRPVTVHEGTDIHGTPNGIYYQLSEW